MALQSARPPSVLALTRQKLKPARLTYSAKNLSRSAPMRSPPSCKKSKAVIFASGSEVEIALDAKAMLDEAGTPTRVVSVPSMELFEKQGKAYKEKVLGTEKIRVAIEAGVRLGWDRFIGIDGIFIGMNGFGASGPGEKVYEHFGITAEAVREGGEEEGSRLCAMASASRHSTQLDCARASASSSASISMCRIENGEVRDTTRIERVVPTFANCSTRAPRSSCLPISSGRRARSCRKCR